MSDTMHGEVPGLDTLGQIRGHERTDARLGEVDRLRRQNAEQALLIGELQADLSDLTDDLNDLTTLVNNYATKTYQAATNGGPTSGTTELVLGTVNVPAQAVATLQTLSVHWTGQATAGGEAFVLRIRENNVSGTIRATLWTPSGTVTIRGASIPAAVTVPVAASTAKNWVATVQRVIGSGTINTLEPGRLTALVIPDL